MLLPNLLQTILTKTAHFPNSYYYAKFQQCTVNFVVTSDDQTVTMLVITSTIMW